MFLTEHPQTALDNWTSVWGFSTNPENPESVVVHLLQNPHTEWKNKDRHLKDMDIGSHLNHPLRLTVLVRMLLKLKLELCDVIMKLIITPTYRLQFSFVFWGIWLVRLLLIVFPQCSILAKNEDYKYNCNHTIYFGNQHCCKLVQSIASVFFSADGIVWNLSLSVMTFFHIPKYYNIARFSNIWLTYSKWKGKSSDFISWITCLRRIILIFSFFSFNLSFSYFSSLIYWKKYIIFHQLFERMRIKRREYQVRRSYNLAACTATSSDSEITTDNWNTQLTAMRHSWR